LPPEPSELLDLAVGRCMEWLDLQA